MQLKNVVTVVLLVAFAACGGGGNGSPTSSTPIPTPAPVPDVGTYSISVDPQNVVAVPSSDSNFPWLAAFAVTVTDAAGLAGNVNYVNVSFISLCGGTSNVTQWNVADIQRAAGSNFVGARSSLRIPLGLIYRSCYGTRTINLRIEVQVIDGHGHPLTYTTSANASIAGDPVSR